MKYSNLLVEDSVVPFIFVHISGEDNKRINMAASGSDFHSIMKDLKGGKYSPVYYLMGDEPFFIDEISDYIRNNAMPEEERDFNQIVLYANDTTMPQIVQRANSYPMGAERQVIIVREAQLLMKQSYGDVTAAEILSAYLSHIQPSTVLVFCHKNGSLDKRLRVIKEIEKNGVLFESKKVRDDSVPAFAQEYLAGEGYSIDPKGAYMLAESVGTDLSRMVQELEKLKAALSSRNEAITPDLVEKLVGISKDYNIFELVDAIAAKNILKVNTIAAYMEKNQKTYPIQMVLASIAPFFANLMVAWYSKDRSDSGIAAELGLPGWRARNYSLAMKNYNARKTMEIISLCREFDAKSKGYGMTGGVTEGLLREFIYRILH